MVQLKLKQLDLFQTPECSSQVAEINHLLFEYLLAYVGTIQK